MYQDTAHIILGVVGDDLLRTGGQLELYEASSICITRIDQVEGRSITGEPEWCAGETVLGIPLHYGPPLAICAVPHAQLGTAVVGGCEGAPNCEVTVGDPTDDIARVLSHQVEFVRCEIEVVDVVQALVLLVHAHQQFIRVVLVTCRDLDLHFLERSEVGHVAGP